MGQDNQKIFNSYLKMRQELIKRKRKKERYGWITVSGMALGVVPLGYLLFGDDSFVNTVERMMTDPLIWLGAVLIVISYGYHTVYYKKAEVKYESLKDELKMRIWNDILFYEQKESFLEETEREYGINLYWK